jgi:hypothetical protein
MEYPHDAFISILGLTRLSSPHAHGSICRRGKKKGVLSNEFQTGYFSLVSEDYLFKFTSVKVPDADDTVLGS